MRLYAKRIVFHTTFIDDLRIYDSRVGEFFFVFYFICCFPNWRSPNVDGASASHSTALVLFLDDVGQSSLIVQPDEDLPGKNQLPVHHEE